MSVEIRLDGSTTVGFRVEVAWGADLTDTDGSGWTWTDITDDVRVDGGVHVKVGRGDEASKPQPAMCTMILDNTGGAYSAHGLSPNWPNVRRGTPIRVSMRFVTTWRTLFIGHADEWSPEWNLKGNDATVKLSASGTLRRLQQNSKPVISPIYRGLTTLEGVVSYWPSEEGKNATVIRQAIGQREMIVNSGTGLPEFAAYSDFDCSHPIPKVKGSSWRGLVMPVPASTGYIRMRGLVAIPDAGGTDGNQVISLWTNGGCELWQVRYVAGSANLRLQVWSGGASILNTTYGFDIDGEAGMLGLSLIQSGPNIGYELQWATPGGGGGVASGTINSKTLGSPTMVDVNWDGGNDEIAVGHVAVQNFDTGFWDVYSELSAYVGELPSDRLVRFLRNEIGIPFGMFGDGDFEPESHKLGPQPLDTVLGIVEDSSSTSQLVIADGTDLGLIGWNDAAFENQDAMFTLDAAAGELAPPFDVVYDDTGIANRVTVTRTDGASATAEQLDGQVGSEVIGLYEDNQEINFYSDEPVDDAANWRLMQGTVGGYRFPKLTVSLRHTPLARTDLDRARYIAERIDVQNLDQAMDGAPAETLRLMVEGYEWQIGSHEIVWTANCSNADRWRVGTLGNTTSSGDTEFTQRLDTAGSELAAAASAGASSLSVTTTDGPIWTTTATRPNDFPFDVEVGGIRLTVTGISGTGSTQTFTVTPSTVTKALIIGSAVNVADVGALRV